LREAVAGLHTFSFRTRRRRISSAAGGDVAAIPGAFARR